MKDIIRRIGKSRWSRAIQCFLVRQGMLLAAGVSYMALFSLTAALTVGWTIFSALLGQNATFRRYIVEASNTMLPGLFETASTPEGLISSDSLSTLPASSAAGVFATIFALFTASSAINSLGKGIRNMFSLPPAHETFWTQTWRRLLGLVMLYAELIVIALSLAVGTIWVNHELSWGKHLIQLAVGFLNFIVMVRYVAAVPVKLRDLLFGGLWAGVGTLILFVLGTSVVSLAKSPVLSAATTLLTVLLWVNLLTNVVFIASAWTANPQPEDIKPRKI